VRVQNSSGDGNIKRVLGVLSLVIGAPLVSIGVFMSGWGILALILDHNSELWQLASVPFVLGVILVSIGFLLCLAWWALTQDSKAGFPKEK
jgi:hypothetical protein